jgi:hypothetical protein
MDKIIYLASPYSHADKTIQEENFRKISKVAADFTSKGFIVISPITYGHTLVTFKPEMPTTWEFWENFCLSILAKCDKMIVVKMEGWDLSRGVKGEIDYATKHNIPIDYIEFLDL